MYSHEGKRLVNQLIAGREQSIGTHLVLGLNTVYDANLDGSDIPTTHNRYHTPYIVDEIGVSNSSVISDDSGGRDRIVFSGQAENSKRYMANNIGLVALRKGGSVRSHKVVANVANTVNWSNVSPVVDPVSVFTNDGVLAIGNNGIALYTNKISLVGYGGDDIIAFPLSFHGGVPTGATIALNIYFMDNGLETYAQFFSVVQYVGGQYYFSFETSTRNHVTTLGTDDAPTPFVFQQRLKDFSNWSNLEPNLANITAIRISTADMPGLTMRFGSVKITPDFEADRSRTTTAFRKLNSVLRKTDVEAYVNPEFTLLGAVV